MSRRHGLRTVGIAAAVILALFFTARPSGGQAPARVFRFAWYEPDHPIDPRKAPAGPTVVVTGNLFEGLAAYEGGEIKLLGATRYETSPDGLVWTFFLRQDARWSDGTPVTAHDYEFAMKTTLDPKFASQLAGLLYPLKNAEAYNTGKMPDANQVGVRAVDDHTLRLTFENRIGYVLQLVTSTAFWPVPRLKVQSLGDKWIEAGNIVSNGPYRLTEWKHDDHMMLVPNPNYWGRKPGVDRVEIRLIPDAEANALRAYEAGELEYAPVSTTDLDRIRGSSQYGPLRFAAIPRLFAVWMDTGHAPFNDVRVRRALYLALDRDKISHVFNGLLAPAWTVIPHRVPGHSDDIRLKGSIEDARRLLAEAGYPEGQRFPPATLVVRSTLQERLFGQLAQSMWKVNLGVGIKVQTLETQAFRAFVQASERRPYDMMSLTGTADIPDPWIYHNYLFGPNVDYYHSRWRDNRYVQLLRPAEVEADPQKRTELYRQLDRIVIEDDTVIIPWAYGNVAYLTRPNVQGLDIFFTAPGPSLRNLVMQP